MAENGERTTLGTGTKFTVGALLIVFAFQGWLATQFSDLRQEVKESYPQKEVVASQLKTLETQQDATRDVLRSELQSIKEQVNRLQSDIQRVEAKIQ